MSRAVVVGGGIAGLAAALRLERLLPGTEIVLVEAGPRLGGKIHTEQVSGFVVEGGPDSFLTIKPRGVGLCEELGLAGRLVPRDPRDSRTYVRLGEELHPLPAGLTGMIPTRLDTLASTGILSADGLARLALEPELPPAPENGDESIAAFVTRRMGREAYERLVEPLMSGIYAGDGEQLSLAATFPQLRRLELEHGSVMRGLLARSAPTGSPRPPFVSLRGGMEELVAALVGLQAVRLKHARLCLDFTEQRNLRLPRAEHQIRHRLQRQRLLHPEGIALIHKKLLPLLRKVLLTRVRRDERVKVRIVRVAGAAALCPQNAPETLRLLPPRPKMR